MDLRYRAQTLLSSDLVVTAVRHFTRATYLPHRARRRLYRLLGRRIRLAPAHWYEYRVVGEPVYLDASSSGAARELYWMGSYEPETTQVFIDRALSARCVVDIGCRDGYFALLAACVNRASKVFAFEPDPYAFEILRAHLTRNTHLHVEAVKSALGRVNGVASFFLAGGNSSLNPHFRPAAREIIVKVARGDDLLPALGARDVDLIKLDTESTEPDVLDGLSETIVKYRPEIICEVLAGRTEAQLESFCRRHDYQIFRMTSSGLEATSRILGDTQHRQLNFLFSHPASHFRSTPVN